MNKEVQSIIKNLQNTWEGEPWYGRAVLNILKDTDEQIVYNKPNDQSHSIIELLFHMITWAEFTVKRLEGDQKMDLQAFEKLDWRTIDPKVHTWKAGLNQLKTAHEKIVEILNSKQDDFLKEIVDYRQYNFRFLLNGLMQHNIYHLGQIAYAMKLYDKPAS